LLQHETFTSTPADIIAIPAYTNPEQHLWKKKTCNIFQGCKPTINPIIISTPFKVVAILCFFALNAVEKRFLEKMPRTCTNGGIGF
jgi:hypothetical protein